MKNPVLPEKEYRQLILNCMVCGCKIKDYFYGVHYFPEETMKGTCGRTCEVTAETRVKYPQPKESS